MGLTPPAIHIRVDPSLSSDDSDEIVLHQMPGGDLFLEIYQGPGLGTQHAQTTLKPEAIDALVAFIGPRANVPSPFYVGGED
jgi:hypothetical protein